MQIQDRTSLQSIEAKGGQLIDTIKQLIHEGNVRRISIKQDGHAIAEFPLTIRRCRRRDGACAGGHWSDRRSGHRLHD